MENYSEKTTLGHGTREVDRLILRKNVNGYGYDLIDRIGSPKKNWLFLFYAQSEDVCNKGKDLLIEGKIVEFETFQNEERPPIVTNQILLTKEKYGNGYYSIPTIDDLKKVALHVLQLRVDIDYIQLLDAPGNQPDFTRADIEKMPESLKAAATKTLNDFERSNNETLENNRQYERAILALEDNDGQIAWIILKERNDYEYEDIEIINLEIIK